MGNGSIINPPMSSEEVARLDYICVARRTLIELGVDPHDAQAGAEALFGQKMRGSPVADAQLYFKAYAPATAPKLKQPTSVHRKTADCVHGYSSLEEAERHCDQGYLIGIGQCPNGCGEMQSGDSMQLCEHCKFFTNTKAGRDRPLSLRMASGEWLVELDDALGQYRLQVAVEGERVCRPVAVLSQGIDEPRRGQQAAHMEILLEALKTTSATGLSPSELHRLVVLMARYVGFFTFEAGADECAIGMRTLFNMIVRRAAEKRFASTN